MLKDKIAHAASALLVFIQQLTHLLNRERLICLLSDF
jgi:hypothetical protein